MISILDIAILSGYFGALAVLSLFGLHRIYLIALYHRRRRAAPQPPAPPRRWPKVTVQLPMYNEQYVAERLIDAVCGLDYEPALLEIQVLDDSTDGTAPIAAARVEHWRGRGVNIAYLRRPDRAGFKAGALEFGLARAEGEFIAVFDADFLPPADFLRATIPHFADARIGMVQARWGYLNRDFSILTRVQALMLDGHFVIEHAARNRGGLFFNFNGTAGVWRRAAIADAGGWQHDTLTEDLDLSYRAQLAGWKFLYLPDVVAPAELPVEINGFKSQQHRWAKGMIQTARKLLPDIWRAALPLRVKCEATFHLTCNCSYPLLLLLALLLLPAIGVRQQLRLTPLIWLDLLVIFGALVSVLAYYWHAQMLVGRGRLRTLLELPLLLALGIGLSVNNTRAVFEALRGGTGEFLRTPKYDVTARGGDWLRKIYRAPAHRSAWFEVLLALYMLLAALFVAAGGDWRALPVLLLFGAGFGYTGFHSLLCVPAAQPDPPA